MKLVCFVRRCRETNLVVTHIERLKKEGVVIPWPAPFRVYFKSRLPYMPTCSKRLSKQSRVSACWGWAKPWTSLVSHRPSQSVISWIKWQLPKWLEQDRWMGRGIKGRSGGGKGVKATEQRPLSQHRNSPPFQSKPLSMKRHSQHGDNSCQHVCYWAWAAQLNCWSQNKPPVAPVQVLII